MEQKGGAHFLNVGIIIYWPNLTRAVFTGCRLLTWHLSPDIFYFIKISSTSTFRFFFPLYNYLNYIFDKIF